MPDGVPPSVWRAFSALIPGFAIIVIVWEIGVLLDVTLGLSIHDAIGVILKVPYKPLEEAYGQRCSRSFLLLLLSAGIHGDSIVASVMAPIWYSLAEQNAAAKVAGEEIPNIISQQFVAIWACRWGIRYGTGSHDSIDMACTIKAP